MDPPSRILKALDSVALPSSSDDHGERREETSGDCLFMF